jgi:hypothetical protein
MSRTGFRVAVAVAGVAAAVLMPASAQAIGDGTCTTLYGTSGGSARVCGDYWRSGRLYDGTYEIVRSTLYVQYQANGGRWITLGRKGTTGPGSFEQLRTFYLRACTYDDSSCGGAW